MLKKWMALVLVLVMFIPTLAFAEDARTFVHETDPYYSYTCPEGWYVLSEESASSLMEIGSSLIDDAQITAALEQVKTMDISIFMAPSTGESVNIVAQALGMDLSADMFMSAVLPTLLQQYPAQFQGFSAEHDGEIVTLGDNEFVKIPFSFTPGGISMQSVQYMAVLNGNLYVITYTATATDADKIAVMEESLQSFSVNPA